MTNMEHWRLAATVLSKFPDGLSEQRLIRILVDFHGLTADEAKAAIAQAIKRGGIILVDGLLRPQEPNAEPPSPAPPDDGSSVGP